MTLKANNLTSIFSLITSLEQDYGVKKIFQTKSRKGSTDVSNAPVLILCPAGNYIFKVNNRNNRTGCEMCSKLTIKTPMTFWGLYC